MNPTPALPADPEEAPAPARSTIVFPVVGIGASAGGLPALLRFFEHMPARNGMAFVVILHLSPAHESSAAAILQRVTQMPVSQVVKPTPVEADRVYVIPPTHDLALNDGYIRLVDPQRERGGHVAIDLFFRTLAEVHQERAIAVVLSGTGTDGAAGLARVKERGGITLVQSPEDAEYDGMPRAAIATGMVDFVLGAVEMPQRLMDLWANAARITLPKDDDPTLKVIAPASSEDQEQAEEALRDIMVLLRSYSKNDFRHYKRATVLRRIERRLQVRSLPNLPAYRDYLREHAEEAKPLLQDMLISVTNFFRDRDAFEALERDVLPGLMEKRLSEENVRVWVAGCATGEEAFSVAMLLQELMEGKSTAPTMQVFATDIDEKAIAAGRTGLYPESIVTDVTPSRVRQFFSKEEGHYRVAKYIREKVLFAQHNLLRDPPFSRLDLICCRNVLIYLDRDAQASVLEMFRFALKPGGYLFLGTSESADAAPNLFTMVDKKNRIYRTNPHAHSIRHLPLLADSAQDRLSARKQSRAEFQPLTAAQLHQQCIQKLVAPSVLIDNKHNVLHLAEDVGRFLTHGDGAPSLNLLANVQSELRTELRTALFQAGLSAAVVHTRPVPVPRGDGTVLVKMTVRSFPETESEAGLSIVMFEEAPPVAPIELGKAEPAHQLLINQLETEIGQLKQHLQETIEQADTSTEELKASNEELQAINEELRSATEELETSREELQSINEELITVNFELKTKVDETGKINDDLQNLVASSDIATVFIDRAMRIKRFTPPAATIFNLIATDIERSLLDITHRLDYDALGDDTQEVLKSLTVAERQVKGSDGRQYLARIRPYRTVDDRIDGAVLTFVDVTALRSAEASVRAGEERLRIAAETTRDFAILTIDEAGIISSWNLGAERLFGYSEKEAIGQSADMIFTPEDRADGVPADEMLRARVDGRTEDERWHLRKDGSTFYCSGVTTYLEGRARGFAKIARDMTARQEKQQDSEDMLSRERATNELKDQFLAVMSHELKHPLNLIQVNTELLVSQPQVKVLPKAARAGEAIRLAVASQTQIIDDLLDLSRTRTGKLRLSLAPTELRELVSAIEEAVRDAARSKGLALQIDIGSRPISAFCDRVRTEQIFWNLINNSIKFTPAGGTVAVELKADGDFAKFTVTDSGRGIAPEFLPEIFGLFKQASYTMSQNTGMGVGLALVRELTEAQGGKVLASSPGLGQGAAFSVWLPLHAAAAVKTRKTGVPPSLKGLKVLLVDDMQDLLDTFAELLTIDGAVTDKASSGEAGLALLADNKYDLLISDLGMEGMDGYAFIRAIRERAELRGLKALALSGYGRQVDVDRALESGFDGHLSKPVTLEQVRAATAKLGLL